MSWQTRSPVLRLFDAFAVIAWTGATTALALKLVHDVDDSVQAGVATLAGLVGYLLADGVCGGVHWFCDRFFDSRTPVLGPLIIAPFREHHEDPAAMTRRSFAEVSSYNCLGVLPLLLLTLAWEGTATILSITLSAGVLTLAIGVGVTNQLHKWAHCRRVPRLVEWLQRRRLILSRREHLRHHRRGFDRAYCVTTGWLNVPLDRLRVFSTLERACGRSLPDADPR